jgi:hypothetical protein
VITVAMLGIAADSIDDNCVGNTSGNIFCCADVYDVMMRGRCYAAYALHESVRICSGGRCGTAEYNCMNLFCIMHALYCVY